MRFSFTEQQIAFRDSLRQLLDKQCTPTDLRAAYERPEARTTRWAALADLGVVGMTVPDAHGGLGLGMTDLVLVLEEAGRVGLPEPLMETTALAAPLLARALTPRSSALLTEIASGSLTAAVADHRAMPPPWADDAPGPSSRGGKAGGNQPVGPRGDPGGSPTGSLRCELVAGAQGADLYLLPTTFSGGRPELHALRAEAVSVLPVAALDPTRRLGTVGWDPTPSSLVAAGEEAHLALADLEVSAALATAAELLGLADRMIDLASSYARDRHQFGKPIGSFQAVKHLLAGAQVKLEFARPAVYAAAWSLDEERDPGSREHSSRRASLAKAYAADAATEAARVALQVHGAIGYTWECDLQLFLKRTWALAEAWGSATDHRRRLLTSLIEER